MSLRAQAYLASLKDLLGESNNQYKLCKKDFKAFIKSIKNISSPMSILRKRTNFAAFWRKLLYRGVLAGAWGIVSNFIVGSITGLSAAGLGGVAFLGTAASILSGPAGWAIISGACLALLLVAGVRLWGYSSADRFNLTDSTTNYEFVKENCKDILAQADDIDISNKEDVTEYINFISGDNNLTSTQKKSRLEFQLKFLENASWSKDTCKFRLTQITEIIKKVNIDSINDAQKSTMLASLLNRVEKGDAKLGYLKQVDTYSESKSLLRSYFGGTATSFGPLITVIFECCKAGVDSLDEVLFPGASKFIIAAATVTLATIGDAISTRCNTGYFETKIANTNEVFETNKTESYKESVKLIQKSLAEIMNKEENQSVLKEAVVKNTNYKLTSDEKYESNETEHKWAKLAEFCKEREKLWGQLGGRDELYESFKKLDEYKEKKLKLVRTKELEEKKIKSRERYASSASAA